MAPHPQADVLRAIADGHQKFYTASFDCILDPAQALYRITLGEILTVCPAMVTVGKHSWPAPMTTAPAMHSLYWASCPISPTDLFCLLWTDDQVDKEHLKKNMCHSTKYAAMQHAKAMIAISVGDV